MLIWRGLGLMVVVVFGVLLMLVGLFFKKSTTDDALHFAVTAAVSAVVWTLFLRRGAQNKLRVAEAEEQLKRPEYLDEKTRKRAEMFVKGKSMMETFDNSTLFFVPIKWWHYILAGLSVVFLGIHFFG